MDELRELLETIGPWDMLILNKFNEGADSIEVLCLEGSATGAHSLRDYLSQKGIAGLHWLAHYRQQSLQVCLELAVQEAKKPKREIEVNGHTYILKEEED